MRQYKELCKAVLERGVRKEPSRKGMPESLSLFGYQFRHDLSEGFPLLTTKKLSFKNIVVELLWFLKGDTNIKCLVDNGCNIWNEDAYNYYVKILERQGMYPVKYLDFLDAMKTNKTLSDMKSVHGGVPKGYLMGSVGKQYGWLWRNLTYYKPRNQVEYFSLKIDQIKELIIGLKNSPESRRHIISAWNPTTLDEMALPACHSFVQFNCRPLTHEERIDFWFHSDKPNRDTVDWFNELTKEDQILRLDIYCIPKYKLDCQLYQRSADLFLGVPYNIASYALLIHIIAKICNMIPGEFIHTFGDVHIYDNHINQIKEQLNRTERKLPTLKLVNDIDWQNYDLDKIWDFGAQLFELKDYYPHSPIKGELSTGLNKDNI